MAKNTTQELPTKSITQEIPTKETTQEASTKNTTQEFPTQVSSWSLFTICRKFLSRNASVFFEYLFVRVVRFFSDQFEKRRYSFIHPFFSSAHIVFSFKMS